MVVRRFLKGNVEHVYAPFVYFTAVRTAFSVAVAKRFHIQQMDVRTAFLHEEIDSDVYILAPEGAGIRLELRMGLNLKKELYGLKQAPRMWHKK